VLGGSFAGLLAARVLAEHFAKVTVLEKDAFSVERAPRPGAPQGRHIHIFLPAGVAALESLFPGAIAELVRDGAQPFDYGRSRLYVYGAWLPRVETNLTALAQTRPFLEQHVREWVARIGNIRLIYGTVGEPLLNRTTGHVTGVEFSIAGGVKKQVLDADLVIDARGRNPRLPRWLEENDFGAVPESSLRIDLGYATGRFCVPKEMLPDVPLLYIVGPPPDQTKIGVIFQAENGIVFGGMGGYHGDHPPAGLEGFLRFAGSLSQPDIYNALAHAELCSRIERFVIPTSTRRHFHKMRRFPARLLPIGDTLCSLDPAFGHGMSLAAVESTILSRCLREFENLDREFTQEYLRKADASVAVAWGLSSRENLKYPQTSGPRPWLMPAARCYLEFLMSAGDPRIMAEMYKIMSLVADPRIALSPSMIVRALQQTICRLRISHSVLGNSTDRN
jgi:2-polyprenyl-6-methoxyphenol hydroxylase-like FAD-dependent oxidoreductase